MSNQMIGLFGSMQSAVVAAVLFLRLILPISLPVLCPCDTPAIENVYNYMQTL